MLLMPTPARYAPATGRQRTRKVGRAARRMLRHASERSSRFARCSPRPTASMPNPTWDRWLPNATVASQNACSESTPKVCHRRGPVKRSVGAGEEVLQRRVLGFELAQGACLDLADPLTRDADLGPDLLERGRLAVAEAESRLQHPPG